jgi:hypothetical protein
VATVSLPAFILPFLLSLSSFQADVNDCGFAGFTTAEAVALSNITIMGGALANFLFNIRRRHPRLPRPLIDWDLILVMEPTTMLGALLGSYLNKLLPIWITSCLLATLLGLLTLKLVQKAVQLYLAEGRLVVLQAGGYGRGHSHQQQQQLAVEDEKEALLHPLLLDQDPQDELTGEHLTAAAAASGGEAGAAERVQSGLVDEEEGLHNFDQSTDAKHQQEQQQVLGACWRISHDQGAYVPPEQLPQQVTVVAADDGNNGSSDSGKEVGGDGIMGGAAGAPLLEPLGSDVYNNDQQQRLAAAAAAALKPHADGVVSYTVCCSVQHQQPGVAALLNATAGPGSCCKLAKVYRREAIQLPFWPLLVLFLLAAAVVASDTLKAWFACGSVQYWLVVLSVVPVCVGVMLAVRQHLLHKGRLKAAAGVLCGGGNVKWSPRNTVLYPCICSLAGVFAGLFGVGGGIIKGPLMLELGVCPEVAAATSATMIAFTAGSACVVYIHFGGLVWSYAWLLLVVAFVVTLLGQITTAALVRVLGRRSVIVWAMVLLMAMATGIAVYQAGVTWAHAVRHPSKMWHGGSICSVQ